MKNNYFLLAVVFCSAMVFSVNLPGQFYTNQLIVGNGGAFNDPSDNVTISSYNLNTQTTTSFGDIQHQSIQDLIIHENYAYVAAEDSIVKFNIDTYEKVASVYESNLNQLFYKNGKLYVSRRSDLNGPPTDGIYLKVFDADDLSLVGSIDGISGDAAGIVVEWDTAYIAVPGDWQASDGKLAVIDNNYNLVREMNFGMEAVGIYDLYSDGNDIFSVNRSPYGISSGSISTYNIWTTLVSTTVLNSGVGKGVAKYENTLFLVLDSGIGSYDLISNEVVESSIIPDPGSSSFIYIADAAYDFLNQLFYVTITDYFSMGEGIIYNNEGVETGEFEAEISAEAIALDFRIDDFSFDDVEYWIGEGDKESLLVIDWNDEINPESVAWGFRFDEETNGEEMLTAIAEADERIEVNISGGFLNDIIFSNGYSHEGIGGTGGFYWGTFSGSNSGNWEMNMGLSTIIAENSWFACSFTDFSPTVLPDIPIAVSYPVGIAKEKEITVSIFPNPANNYFHVNAKSIMKIELYNSYGKLVLRNIFNKNNQALLNIEGLPFGIYFIEIETLNGRKTERIIKK